MDAHQVARAMLTLRMSSSSPLVKKLRSCQNLIRCHVHVQQYLDENPKFRLLFQRSGMSAHALIQKAKLPRT